MRQDDFAGCWQGLGKRKDLTRRYSPRIFTKWFFFTERGGEGKKKPDSHNRCKKKSATRRTDKKYKRRERQCQGLGPNGDIQREGWTRPKGRMPFRGTSLTSEGEPTCGAISEQVEELGQPSRCSSCSPEKSPT